KRKVSGGTRSDLGRQCRDTFASLKKTWPQARCVFLAVPARSGDFEPCHPAAAYSHSPGCCGWLALSY
ncbi:MAG: hypothetical protein ABIR56_19320, partial [Polaromonas sp.]